MHSKTNWALIQGTVEWLKSHVLLHAKGMNSFKKTYP